jgi:hypothetical protein
MRRGVTVAWLGWQWDAREGEHMLRLYSPRARELEGVSSSENKGASSGLQVRGANAASNAEINRALSPAAAASAKAITGLVRADFTVNERQDEHPLGHMISGNIGGTEYACSDPQDAANVLTVRDAPMASRQIVPRSEWQFVAGNAANGEAAPPTQNGSGRTGRELRAIRLKGGFEPGKIYELVYRAQDPAIAGLGFRGGARFCVLPEARGNELAPATQRVHALGISQSGRFLRHFLLEGFNADETGQRAIDGTFIHVAGAGIGSFNHRFAQPSRDAQPTTALFYPTDLFPFTDAPQKEPESRKKLGLLDRYLASGSTNTPHLNPLPKGEEDAKRQVRADSKSSRGRGAFDSPRSKNAKHSELLPKIFHTNTSYEYWSRAGSLIHTSPDGEARCRADGECAHLSPRGTAAFLPRVSANSGPEPSLAAQHLPNPNPGAVVLARAVCGDG